MKLRWLVSRDEFGRKTEPVLQRYDKLRKEWQEIDCCVEDNMNYGASVNKAAEDCSTPEKPRVLCNP
jgi:hypothetical protein